MYIMLKDENIKMDNKFQYVKNKYQNKYRNKYEK